MVALNFSHLLFTLFGVHGKMMLLGCRLFCFHCFQHLRYFFLIEMITFYVQLPSIGKVGSVGSTAKWKTMTGFVMSGTSLLTGTKTTIKDVLWDSRCVSTSNSLSHPCLSPSPSRRIESFGFHLHPHVMADSALIKSVMLLEAKRKKGTMCGLTRVCVSSSMRV